MDNIGIVLALVSLGMSLGALLQAKASQEQLLAMRKCVKRDMDDLFVANSNHPNFYEVRLIAKEEAEKATGVTRWGR